MRITCLWMGLCLVAFVTGATAAFGQDLAAEAKDVAPVAAASLPQDDCNCATIPALTPVEIELTSHLGSKISKTGDRFSFRLASPVSVSGRDLVPAGTPGEGEVVHAKKAGGSGAPGELVLAARFLEFQGSRMRLRSMNYRATGRNDINSMNTLNTVAAATVPALSIIGFLSHGGEVDLPEGVRATAKTTEAVIISWPSKLQAGPAVPPPGDQAIPPATGEVK